MMHASQKTLPTGGFGYDACSLDRQGRVMSDKMVRSLDQANSTVHRW